MIVKPFLTITDPNRFLETNGHSGMMLCESTKWHPEDWIQLGQIEIGLVVDLGEVTKRTVEGIRAAMDKKTSVHEAEMMSMRTRIDELMALPAPAHYDESRPVAGGNIKNTLTGEVTEPTTIPQSEIDNG